MKKERGKVYYRIAFMIMCFISLVLHFKINDEFFNYEEFSYFTVQSNIFCFIMMAVLLFKEFHGQNVNAPVYLYFHGMAVSAIFCTAYIYHFSESVNKYDLTEKGLISIPLMDLFGHYIVPVMFLIDWFAFVPKGLLKRNYIFQWLAFPLVYLLCFLSRCNFNENTAFLNVRKYPYPFLNYEKLGSVTFFKYIFGLTMVLLTINTLIYTLDYLINIHQKKSC